MLCSASALQGYAIYSREGEFGKVHTFYFDVDEWAIHYVVVNTGGWFSGNYVLLPVDVLGPVDRTAQSLVVHLTQEEIRQSPEVPQQTAPASGGEMAMQSYHGRNVSWSTDPFVLQAAAARPGGVPVPARPPETPPEPHDNQGSSDVLRSTREVLGYYIQASDGSIGHIEDFLIDPTTWHIRHIIVDTRNWLPGKKVLVSPNWLRRVDWDTMQVEVDLTQERIRNSPEYDPNKTVDRAYEKQLFEFYKRPHYWENERKSL